MLTMVKHAQYWDALSLFLNIDKLLISLYDTICAFYFYLIDTLLAMTNL